jgi:hypothetical protein
MRSWPPMPSAHGAAGRGYGFVGAGCGRANGKIEGYSAPAVDREATGPSDDQRREDGNFERDGSWQTGHPQQGSN